ncbi:MAG: hypothetical protein E6872_02805 [Enterobacter sp.]|nr:hypothetical protein [Enterobacter sp.]MDU1559450.1 hypothetical protein [Enterobacter sp.]
MNLYPAATIRLGGHFYGLIDKLYPRPHRNVIEQVFDIVITQANAALADAQANAEI